MELWCAAWCRDVIERRLLLFFRREELVRRADTALRTKLVGGVKVSAYIEGGVLEFDEFGTVGVDIILLLGVDSWLGMGVEFVDELENEQSFKDMFEDEPSDDEVEEEERVTLSLSLALVSILVCKGVDGWEVTDMLCEIEYTGGGESLFILLLSTLELAAW